MFENRKADDLSIEELEQLLYRRKRAQRQDRLRRLKDEGRLVEVAGVPRPSPEPLIVRRPEITDADTLTQYDLGDDDGDDPAFFGVEKGPPVWRRRFARIVELIRRLQWRWMANKALLMVELGAVAAFVVLLFSFLDTRRELNQELRELQTVETASMSGPLPTATPLIDVVLLPSGHKPPVEGRPPEPGEAGYVPDHLLPIINNYVPPPIPTPGPEQARRIQIPAISVDSTIVQGDDWEQLKKGVGQHIGTAQPGREGNLVLSAHNDIYGELFRHLDKLSPGDEIIVSTERQSYTYVIREIEVVEPTETWVMASTEHASATLISCYPYLVNDKRIVVFADLADERRS